MPISFADVPLLLPDPQGELSQWIEKYLSLRDLRLWGARPLVREDLSAEPRTVDRYRVPMPQVNWPAPPAMRLNTLWWPTGATRWAAGLFLADKERLDAIVGAVGDDGGGTLVLDEGPERRSIDPWMHLLSPRRITACGDSPLYLLPLVDVRYFWQLRHVRLQGQVTNDTTWTQLLGLLEAALEITVSAGAIPTEYGRPDPIEWSRAGQSGGPARRVCVVGGTALRLLLDAAALPLDRLRLDPGQRGQLRRLAARGRGQARPESFWRRGARGRSLRHRRRRDRRLAGIRLGLRRPAIRARGAGRRTRLLPQPLRGQRRHLSDRRLRRGGRLHAAHDSGDDEGFSGHGLGRARQRDSAPRGAAQ